HNRRLDHVDGRMHEDGVPYPPPYAAEPRLLRRHTRRADRQGLGTELATAPAGGCALRRDRCILRTAGRRRPQPVTDFADRGPMRSSFTEVAFAWFQRLVAGYCLLFGVLY